MLQLQAGRAWAWHHPELCFSKYEASSAISVNQWLIRKSNEICVRVAQTTAWSWDLKRNRKIRLQMLVFCFSLVLVWLYVNVLIHMCTHVQGCVFFPWTIPTAVWLQWCLPFNEDLRVQNLRPGVL